MLASTRTLRSNSTLGASNSSTAKGKQPEEPREFSRMAKSSRRQAGAAGVNTIPPFNFFQQQTMGNIYPSSVDRRDLDMSSTSFGPQKRSGDDDDLSGIVGTMKKMKVDPLNNYETPELAIPAEALIPAFPALQSFSTAMDEFDEFDDAPSVLEPSSMAPGGQLEDDASDYFPSDTEETDDRSTPASSNRRLARGIKIIENMREYFNLNYKTPSIHLFGGEDRDPPSWGARLRKYNAEEERWVEKGPVVLMLLPCRPDAPFEARLVAHYTFGTQSAAINMPISPFHQMAIIARGRRALVSSLGSNIIGKAIIKQQPKKLREALPKPLNEKDERRLNDAQRTEYRSGMRIDEISSPETTPAKASTSASNPDCLVECLTTVIGVKEEGSSLYVLRFQTREETKSFAERFTKASIDYGRSLAEQRAVTFTTPQPAQRLLLSGQLVALPHETSSHLSPFAANAPAVRALAASGLIYIPVSSDAVLASAAAAAAASGMDNAVTPIRFTGGAAVVTEHRFVCWHCKSVMSIPVEVVGEGCQLGDGPAERIMEGHRTHPMSTRWELASQRTGASRASGTRQAYRCPLGFENYGKGGLVNLPATDAPMGRARRTHWDPIVISMEE